MCFTGGFALAMMVDQAVAAPVVCQPSVPFAVGRKRARGPQPLPRRPRHRPATGPRRLPGARACSTTRTARGTRFETLTQELGEAFIRVEFPGRKHSTVTAHRQQEGVDRVLAFFREKLAG